VGLAASSLRRTRKSQREQARIGQRRGGGLSWLSSGPSEIRKEGGVARMASPKIIAKLGTVWAPGAGTWLGISPKAAVSNGSKWIHRRKVKAYSADEENQLETQLF